MNNLAYLAYILHCRGILIFQTYMAITCFLSHDADSAINETIAYDMLRRLFRGIYDFLCLCLYQVLASVSSSIDPDIDVM